MDGKELERYVEDIESRLDEEQEERVLADWLTWAHHENAEGPFRAAPRRPMPSKLTWPHVNINDAIADDTLSVYRELEALNRALASGSPFILRVRGNYGVGNVATSFGCPLFVMPRETDTLPNVKALGEEKTLALIGQPLPDLEAGNFAAVMRFAKNFGAIRAKYPKIRRFVRVEQPDLQGPLDNLELIMGSSPLFYAMYDDPDSVHALLDMIAKAMERFMNNWLATFPGNASLASYFYHVEEGMLCIRDDSAMNLSPEMYAEFAAPYDGYLLEKFGGIVHFCGRGDHYVDRLTALKGLKAVNMSQPHLNDMEKMFAYTIDRGLHLGITAPETEITGHDVRNLVWLPY